MDPLCCLIGFLQIFVMKFEKLNEIDIQVTQREEYDVLPHSLPEYWKNEMTEISVEIGDNEELLKYAVKIGVKWIKLHPRCHHILPFSV